MKKILLVALALCLLVSCAFAESADVTKLTWDSSDVVSMKDSLNLEGDFATVEGTSIKYWLPANLKETELSEDEKNGYGVVKYQNDDGSFVMLVKYMQESPYADVQALYDKIAEQSADFVNLQKIEVNGLSGISYMGVDQNGVFICLLDNGSLAIFSFGGVKDNTEYTMEAAVIGASVSLAQ